MGPVLSASTYFRPDLRDLAIGGTFRVTPSLPGGLGAEVLPIAFYGVFFHGVFFLSLALETSGYETTVK